MTRSLQGAAVAALLVPAAVVVVGTPASADVCSSVPLAGQTCQTVSTLLGGSPSSTTTTTQPTSQSTTTTTTGSSPVAAPTTLPPLPAPLPALPAPLNTLPLPGSSPSSPSPAPQSPAAKAPAAAAVTATAPAAGGTVAAPSFSTGSSTGTAATGDLARGTGFDLPASGGSFDLGPAPLPKVRTRTYAPALADPVDRTTPSGSLRRQLPPFVVGLAVFLVALMALAHAFTNAEGITVSGNQKRR